MGTHNQCFGAKIRKNVNPCKPQFYYIKVGCKGAFVTRTCFRDDKLYHRFLNDFFRNLELSMRNPGLPI